MFFFIDGTTLFLLGGAVFLGYYKGDTTRAARGVGYSVGRAVG